MKVCNKCGGKGYLEEWYHYAAKARPMIRQCCDLAAYSRRVQLLFSTPEEAFKSAGKKEPFIGREMTVTGKGLEFTGERNRSRKQGEPCPVIPLPKR